MTGNGTHVINGSSNLEIAHSNQDLIITKGRRKKRTWIIVGIVCAVIVITCITILVYVLNKNPHNLPNTSDKVQALSLGDVLNGRSSPRPFNATWISDSELLYMDGSANIVIRDVSSPGKPPTVIFPHFDPILRTSFKYELSHDRKYLLINHDYQKLYRYSYRAKHTVVNLETNEKEVISVRDNEDLQLVVWSPRGSSLALVHENNIYYKETPSEDPIQITFDSGFISNGVPDWVYEEEVLSSNQALWFSHDGQKIAFAKFDDTQVPVIVIPIYGEPGNLIFQYPKANIVKYPKAGTRNPTVTLHVVDIGNFSLVEMLEPPDEVMNKKSLNTNFLWKLAQRQFSDSNFLIRQPILSAVTWADNETLTAIWMNRVQNEAVIATYQTTQPFTTKVVRSISEKNGWLELFTPPIFSADGTEMVIIMSADQGSDLGGYRHIMRLQRTENAVPEPLTKGTFVVTEILSWNEKDKVIYYLATTELDSSLQHLYSVSTETKQVKCLSCGVKFSIVDRQCLYNTAEFSKDHSFYVLTCAGPYVPEITVFKKTGERAMNWFDNPTLQKLVAEKKTPITRKLSYEIADGFRANVYLKLPPDVDTSGNTKYPMLVNVYGGPDSYQVIEKFNLDWGSYLASNKSIIYATIDGRGSGLRGDKLLFSLYRRLGTVEIIDQINVTKQIQETLPYVDASRTAIWGWSYGGYASGLALATDTDGVFKCGISVAPVTDWALYDSIYTERFMGLPSIEDNFKGYQRAQLLKKYEGLRHKLYFLIHGTYDDNVHYQQSMMWARTLELNDILFRQLSYPDEDHGLGSVRPHLYHSLENFLDECFIQEGE